MKTVLVIGGTRNLGKALCTYYTAQPNTIVHATARYGKPVHNANKIHWISDIDISHEKAGRTLELGYTGQFPIDIVYVVATGSHSNYSPETLDNPDMDAQVNMYRTFTVGPLFLVHHLVRSNLLAKGAKIIFIGNEAGSIALRNKGGDYGYHGSQAALNMTARLLSFDLKPKGIAVAVVYPGHMVVKGESKHKIHGDEVAPGVAASAVAEFVENQFSIANSGQLYAARGFASLPDLSGHLAKDTESNDSPIELPW